MTNEPTAQNGATITYPRNIRLTEPPMPAGSTIGRRWASVHSAGATCQPHFFPFRSRATAGQVSTRRAGTIGEWDRRCVMQQPSYGRRNQQHRSGHTTCAATEDRATHHQQYHHKRLKSRVGRLNLRTVVLTYKWAKMVRERSFFLRQRTRACAYYTPGTGGPQRS
jgi:hypothetical protein